MARPTQTPSNCKLPLLQQVVDRERLADELVRRMEPTFAAGGNRVRGCRIEQLYYKPGGECRILFGMQFQPPDTDRTVRQLFYGCIHSESAATDSLESIDPKRLVEPRLGRPVSHLADWDMVVWAFPNDPQLRGLPMLADKGRVLERLRAAPERYGLNDAPVAIEAERTKYVPGRRCGYRFRLTLGNGSTQTIYAKSYARSVAERAYRSLNEVANSRPARDGELIVPRPYCLDEDTDVV